MVTADDARLSNMSSLSSRAVSWVAEVEEEEEAGGGILWGTGALGERGRGRGDDYINNDAKSFHLLCINNIYIVAGFLYLQYTGDV